MQSDYAWKPCSKLASSKSENIFYTGTPIRGELGTLTRELARAKLGIKKDERLILSFGGSLGAARMNEAIIDFMKKYSLNKKKIKHIHGCGAIYFKELEEQYPKLANGVNGCQIVEYIDRMPLYMKAADLAITRSGAITLSELREAGTPSILIPSPNVSDNHQLKNAEELSALGGAVVITEDKLSCAELIDTVGSIIESGPTLHKMRGALERTKPINTGTIISDVIKNALNK